MIRKELIFSDDRVRELLEEIKECNNIHDMLGYTTAAFLITLHRMRINVIMEDDHHYDDQIDEYVGKNK